MRPAGGPGPGSRPRGGERPWCASGRQATYRTPTARTLAGRDRQTPAGFVFARKAPRRVTHEARLRDVTAAGRLAALLARVPPGLRVALEVRHPSWLDDEGYRLLRAHHAALCVADPEGGTTPVVRTTDVGCRRVRDRASAPADLRAWTERARRRAWRAAVVHVKPEDAGTGPGLARALRAALSA